MVRHSPSRRFMVYRLDIHRVSTYCWVFVSELALLLSVNKRLRVAAMCTSPALNSSCSFRSGKIHYIPTIDYSISLLRESTNLEMQKIYPVINIFLFDVRRWYGYSTQLTKYYDAHIIN